MAEKLEDLNLPNSSVNKIIKEAVPESVNIGKDAKSALSRAASVFVLYVTSQASREAQKVNRKTLIGQDVIDALEELEFEDFIAPLKEMLKEFKDSKQKKEKAKTSKKTEENNAEHVEPEEDNTADTIEEDPAD